MIKKAIPELSIDAQMLEKRIFKLKHNEIVEYKELSKLIGRNVQKEARGYLVTARKRIENNFEGWALGTIPNVGVKRMTDESAIGIATEARMKTTRALKKARKRVVRGVSDYEELSPDKQREYNTELTHTGIMISISNPKAVKKIEAILDNSLVESPVPTAKCLEAIKKAIG